MKHPFLRYSLLPYLHKLTTVVTGIENVPKNKPFILAGNHVSFFDGVVLAAKLFDQNKNKIKFISNSTNILPLFRPIVSAWSGVVFVNKKNPSTCLDEAARCIYKGSPIGIFPEGLRIPRGNAMARGKTGAIRLALATKIPIIPVGIITKGEPHRYRHTNSLQKIIGTFEDAKHRILTTTSSLIDPTTTNQKYLSGSEMMQIHNSIYSVLSDACDHYFIKSNRFELHFGKPITFSDWYDKQPSYKELRTLTNNLMRTIGTLCYRNYPHTD